MKGKKLISNLKFKIKILVFRLQKATGLASGKREGEKGFLCIGCVCRHLAQ